MSQESANIIIMCAFGAHSLKEVSRGQLASAAKFFLKGTERKLVPKADKHELVSLLAPFFIQSGVVAIRDGASSQDLERDDVTNEGTF